MLLGFILIKHLHFPAFSSADSFETMLKSLLGYQSGMGGGATESVIRKKVYESAINNTLNNNFPLVLKVCITHEKTYLLLQNVYLCLFIYAVAGGGAGGQVEVIP